MERRKDPTSIWWYATLWLGVLAFGFDVGALIGSPLHPRTTDETATEPERAEPPAVVQKIIVQPAVADVETEDEADGPKFTEHLEALGCLRADPRNKKCRQDLATTYAALDEGEKSRLMARLDEPDDAVDHEEKQPLSSKGKFACTSKPLGAEVWINGRNTGFRTPIAISNAIALSPGKHSVVFKLDGKSSVPLEVTIEADTISKVIGAELSEPRVTENRKGRSLRVVDQTQLAAARTQAMTCLKLNPANAECHKALGAIYERLGETENASAEYRQFLRLAPTGVADLSRSLPATIEFDRYDRRQ